MSDPIATEPATSEVALKDVLADLRPTPPAAEPAPVPEPVTVTDPTPTQPPADSPADPAPAAEVVEVAPPAAEPAPATPDAEPEIDYKAQYEALLKEHTQVVAGLNTPPDPAQPQQQTTTPTPQTTPPQFVSEQEFDDVVSSPVKFNEFCARLVAETAKVAHEAAVERVYREIPSLIGMQVNHQLESRVVSDAFFKDNPDVQQADPELFKREFLIQKNAKPGASMFELLRETATSMRSKGYVRPVKAATPANTPPALVGGTTQRGTAPRAKPALSGIAAQVDAELGALRKGRA